jgi:hypothetical protein
MCCTSGQHKIPSMCRTKHATDGHSAQSAGDKLQLQDSLSNLREMSCNGWNSYSNCGKSTTNDGKSAQFAEVILLVMAVSRILGQMKCNTCISQIRMIEK